jgi:hypothetical protein
VAVVTADILVEGVRRDAVFAWLSDPANHGKILDGAFDGCVEEGPGDFSLTVKTGPRSRSLQYHFDRCDDSHGGRRVYVNTDGKRFRGTLSYSLRTMKPSTNTLVTMHLDFDPGSVLGQVVLASGLKLSLHEAFRRALDNLSRSLPRG